MNIGNLAANGVIGGLVVVWLAPQLSLIIDAVIGFGIAAVIEMAVLLINRRFGVDRAY
ncbi:MAG: hypothetical protein ACLQVD_08060 [Capsulimonadaceae bacterium]